ncbi:MAG: YHS domain-containing protein [Bryobacteraceae bacterium]
MLRLLTYLLISLFLVTILRNIVGVILRGFSQMMNSRTAQNGTGPSVPPSVPLTGELKKDPVCGTYTAAATSIQQTVHGQTFYFCSAQCRDKYLTAN